MKAKQRLLLRYGSLGAAILLLCVWGTLALLHRDREGGLGVTNVLLREIPEDAAAFRFERMELDWRHFPGPRAHLLPEDMGSGVAMEDFDGDGRKDLFFVQNGPLSETPPPCALFRNLGDWRFERVDSPLPALHGQGVAVADYDADGDFDLYVTGYLRNVLLRNEGGLRFTDVTKEAGVAGGGFSAGACWGDADGDGDLDLYVCRYVEFGDDVAPVASQRGTASLPATLNPSVYPSQSNLLYLNEGGTFREAAAEFGVANPRGKSLAAVFADLDLDGVLDLYVANDVTDNVLLHGQRGARYVDQSHISGTADWRGAMGLAVGDPDRDGDLDLFITHWQPEENALYLREQGLRFTDGSLRSYLGPPGRGKVGWACGFADFDLDGRPDVYVINGSTFEMPEERSQLVPMRMQLFWNGGTRFWDLAQRAGSAAGELIVGRGAACGDLDGDGDPDLVVMVHGGEPRLLRNDTKTGEYLVVEPRGAAPNLFAYGALVTVEVSKHLQMQQVGTKVSYLSAGPHELRFGLGAARFADRVVVRFPSGHEVVRHRVPAGSRLVVKEFAPRTLGPDLDAARDALTRGDHGQARTRLRAVLQKDPMHVTALYELARLAPPAEALALCRRLVAAEPMAPRGYLLAAQLQSDPQAIAVMDLDAALRAIRQARRLNRDETGGAFQEGRIRLLQGDVAGAAKLLEHARINPEAAALAALCRFRLGEPESAWRLLQGPATHGPEDIPEEGDTKKHRMGDRVPLARLLLLGRNRTWKMERATQDGAPPVATAMRFRPFSRADAVAFALDPPARCQEVPPGTTAVAEADADGDGDLDLFVACGGNDPTLPLPWWLLRKEADGYRPVRGDLPEPGFCVVALAAKNGSVTLRGENGETWVASLR